MKFTKKLIQVLGEEVLNQSMISGNPLGLGFSKKIVKIYKAMSIMEKQKSDFLKFSQDYKELVLVCYKHKNLDLDNTSINFSKGSAADLENSSLITGMDAFGGLSKINDNSIEKVENDFVNIDKGLELRASLENMAKSVSRNYTQIKHHTQLDKHE